MWLYIKLCAMVECITLSVVHLAAACCSLSCAALLSASGWVVVALPVAYASCLCFPSCMVAAAGLAHTEEDIDFTIAAAKRAFARI
jgi:ABC-type transport system involved in cytochrome bd biosynthesis fused ATPase/permease subunit